MVLLLMSSLVAVVPARPVQANVSSITVTPYDTAIIGLPTGYRITMTTGASLNAGDNITIEFPAGTTVLDFSATPGNAFVQDTPCSTVAVSVRQVKVTIPAIAPIVPGQQFTVTFNKACNITNPTTSGSRTVVAWTSVETTHITSSSYEITAVKVYTGATQHSENATITGAIAAAITGDTITVPAGTYVEKVTVNKANLTIRSESKGMAVIDVSSLAAGPSGNDPAVLISANGVTFDGFTVVGSDKFNLGTSQIKFGVYLGSGVTGCTISNNTVRDISVESWVGAGIVLYRADSNTLIGNTCTSNQGDGIDLCGLESAGGDGCDSNTIISNTSTNNGFNGIILNWNCKYNTVEDNTANINKMGICIARGSDTNTFTNNTASGNSVAGIYIQDLAALNTITGNTLTGNCCGVLVWDEGGGDPHDNAIHLNNIAENTGGCTWNGGGTGVETLVSGVHNSTTVAATLNATNNYWGHASGPSHLSPVAYGDNVTANVTFRPWLVTTYTGTAPAGEITIATTSPLPDGTTGVYYSTPLSTAGGTAPYTWAYYSGTLPPGLNVSGSNFSGTPSSVNTTGFNFALQVKDATQATYQDFTMKVYGGGHNITTTSPLPGGTKNVPYGPVQLQATGGTGTYAWSLNVGSGPLPTGLSLGPSDGKISGTPTAAGPFTFTVKVTSDGYAPGTKDFSITISAPSSGGQKLIGADASITPDVPNGGNYFILSRFAATASDNITQFRVRCTTTGNVKVAIYSDNNSQPYTLLNAVNDSTVVGAGWNTISFPSTPIISNTNYWLAFCSSGNIVGAKSGSGVRRFKPATFSSFTTFPSNAGIGFATDITYYDVTAGWAAVTVTAPTVTNYSANVTQTSARLNGGVTGAGGENPTVIIYWGPTDGGTTYTNWANSVNKGTQSGTFSTDIADLTPSTTYHYRCYASNSGGTDWADSTQSFTTSTLSAPEVTNSTGASSVTATSARLNGAITNTGGANPTVTIYWGDNDGRTTSSNWDNTVPLGVKDAVTFSTDIIDLNSGTKYYYRCFALNSSGPAWAASSENFTTLLGGVGQKLIGADASTTSDASNASNYFILSRFTATASGDMTEFRVRCTAAGNIKVAVYADNSGEPGSLLNSVSSTPVTVVGWNTITFPSTPIISGYSYWLAFCSDGNIVGAKAGTGVRRFKPATFSTFTTFPSNAGTGFTSDTTYYDVTAGWATVTPALPATPVLVTPKKTITFEWNISSRATKYRLQVNTASDFTGTSMFDAEVSTTSQAVTLTVGTPYYWRVKAGNTGGWSGWSSTGSVTP
jgi:parallel beta-helix repeat protein